MSALEIGRQQQRLDDLFSKAKLLADTEMQAHWCRYLCVLVSGYIENSVRETFSEVALTRSDPVVANFVQNRLRQFQNPKMGNILDLLAAFSQQWKLDLETSTDGQLSESINSIVGNRHKIAHGDSVSLTLSSLRQYYRDAIRVIELLRQQCGV